MAPSADVEPRSDSTQGGTIAIAVLVSVGGAIIVTFLFLTILVIWRRKRGTTDNLPYHVTAPPLKNHKLNTSDASVNPLLVDGSRGDWDYPEKFYPPNPASTNEAARDDQDIMFDPAGLYHMPSAQTMNHTTFSPTPSSYCLPHVLEIKSANDPHPHTPSTTTERRPLPILPPLIIPEKHVPFPYTQSRYPAAVDEELSPEQPPSSSTSTVSLYSERTADSGPTTPPVTYVPLPLSQELGYDTAPTEGGLHRGDTHLVGNLLKARARRNPDGLVRASSHVSHIERTGSIKSVSSVHQDHRPYSKRYRSKKLRTAQKSEMEVVKEASEGGSLRSRSDSSAAHWDPSLLIQIPPRVAGPRSPPLRKA